jgi:hypothetical protein
MGLLWLCHRKNGIDLLKKSSLWVPLVVQGWKITMFKKARSCMYFHQPVSTANSEILGGYKNCDERILTSEADGS